MGPIDRVAPTRRPAGRVVMKQRWEELLFLHWRVDPAALAALLPAGLTLDTHDGHAYVGLVPFTMRGVRPVYLPPVPGISDFHETNVRTYVHVDGRDPGVWFFSLDAAGAVGVWLGRALFHLPYFLARMSLQRITPPEGAPLIEYHTERRIAGGARGPGCDVRYRPRGPVTPAAVGTLEHFLAERYLLYSQKGERLWKGQVHHAPYPLQQAEVLSWSEDLLQAAGIHRGDEAPLAHYASGVTVDVFGLSAVR